MGNNSSKERAQVFFDELEKHCYDELSRHLEKAIKLECKSMEFSIVIPANYNSTLNNAMYNQMWTSRWSKMWNKLEKNFGSKNIVFHITTNGYNIDQSKPIVWWNSCSDTDVPLKIIWNYVQTSQLPEYKI
jgi:hypothetical protein